MALSTRARPLLVRPLLLVGLATLWILCARGALGADELPSKTTQLSDSAFAMLNAVNAGAEKDDPMLAPVASLAGDAQTLASAVQGGDLKVASHAMAAIDADEKSIDEVAAKNAGKLNASQWNGVKGQIAALEKEIPPVAGPAGPSIPAAATGPAPAAAEDSPAAQPDAPRVLISSRVFSDSRIHLHGFFEGTDLKSAGIFDGDELRKAIAIGHESGSQRVNFDFTIEEPPPGESIRVFDNSGRSAQAMVVTDTPMSVSSAVGPGRDKMIELGGGMTDDSVASAEPAPAPLPEPESHNNTAEIPTETPDGSTVPPRRFPGGVGRLTNVQINVLGVVPSISAPGSYEVVGQISGAGVRRAGVYLGGRLVKTIPITLGSYSSFDVSFPMRSGAGAATIRAYGLGSDFVEASIETADNGMTQFDSSTTTTTNYPTAYPSYYGATPYGANPYAQAYPNPYAPNPYGAAVTPYGTVVTPYGAAVPYGAANPYGINPYAPRPYPYGYPPYAAPPTAPATPWWKKVF
ncbi:MAG TPA: hypothetical protein VIX59_07810 [Candidatus Binataceae bacterium]